MESIAIFYLSLLSDVREAAKRHGYAIGIHGSMSRDFDLIAAPWVDHPSPPDVLIEAIRNTVNGTITPTGTVGARWDAEKNHFVDAIIENPKPKPCGRLAWNIQIGGGAVLDVSVMPRGGERP